MWGRVLVLATLSEWARSITVAELGRVLVLALMCWDCVLAMMCWDCILATLCTQTRSVHGMVRVLVVPTVGRDC